MAAKQLLAGLVALVVGGAAMSAGAAEGDQIAFLGLAGGQWQAYVAAPDGSGVRQLTRSPGDKTRISWYPDGRALFVSAVDGRLLRVDVASGAETLLEIPSVGSVDAVLSPDATWVAFSVSPAQARDQNEIFVVRHDGSERRKLTRMAGLQHQPAWSPDGRWLYFVAGDGVLDHDVWRVAPGGGESEQLTAGQGFHFDVTVGPDGTLAFSSNRSGSYDLWVLPPGGEPTRVTEDPAADGSPTWSPDGETLLFESSRGGAPGLWRVSRSGGEVTRVATPVPARNPVWWHAVPDGGP